MLFFRELRRPSVLALPVMMDHSDVVSFYNRAQNLHFQCGATGGVTLLSYIAYHVNLQKTHSRLVRLLRLSFRR